MVDYVTEFRLAFVLVTIALLSLSVTHAAQATDGACGSANGAAVTSAPTTNLCAVGSASLVYGNGAGSGPWSWDCYGAGGGSTAYCVAPVAATSTHLGQAIPASLFGMHAFFASDNPPTVSIGTLGKGGCQSWAEAEPARGTYNWSNFDFEEAWATRLGIDGLVTVYGIPGWAVSGQNLSAANNGAGGITSCGYETYDGLTPNNLSDVTTFWTAFAQRYCGSSIHYVELGNEPYGYWQTNGSGYSTPGNAAGYAKYTTYVYNAIRAACPSMKIIAPSLAAGLNDPSYYEGFAEAYYAAGAPTGVDVVSIHAGGDSTYPPEIPPEAIMPGGYLFDSRLVNDIDTWFPGKPLFNTESGWGRNDALTIDEKAASVSRWFILHWAAGFSRMYWDGWDNADDSTLDPALNPPGSSIPATAYQQTYNWLVGNIMYNGCSVASDGVTWSCQLAGSNGYSGLIVWDTAGNESFTPPTPSMYTDYRDLSGNVTRYSGGAVTVGIKPILFEN
jgi:hypothetical protein